MVSHEVRARPNQIKRCAQALAKRAQKTMQPSPGSQATANQQPVKQGDPSSAHTAAKDAPVQAGASSSSVPTTPRLSYRQAPEQTSPSACQQTSPFTAAPPSPSMTMQFSPVKAVDSPVSTCDAVVSVVSGIHVIWDGTLCFQV